MMTLEEQLLFVDKPGGVATHATEAEAAAPEGLCEHLARHHQKPLWVCHRLDKGTTGAMVFAGNAETAARLSGLFKDRDVSKAYLFLTDRATEGDAFTVESRIEKRGSTFVSTSGEVNAITEFRRLKTEGHFSLWEAKPKTGRPHQIRLHATSRGIPILGDSEHQGSEFPALCLHAQELQFDLEGQTYSHSTPSPRYFGDLTLLSNRRLCAWLAACDRRERWQKSKGEVLETIRWIHSEGGPLRAEQLGETVDLQWFAATAPSESDWSEIRTLAKLMNWNRWRLHLRLNRGKNPNEQSTWQSEPELPEKWTAREADMSFEFRANQGLSSGLFLDQRANRLWVRENSQGRRVLNLFCYTGGFSVAAALGGAAQIVSVDVSRNFLEWTKTNFVANGIAIEDHEFRAMDVRDYLKYAAKKELRYDLIICDPPSFGRSDKGVFRIEKDLPELLKGCANVLETNGRILFSCNFEGWDEDGFFAALRKAAAGLRLRPPPASDWDFELPREPRIMKSALLEKL